MHTRTRTASTHPHTHGQTVIEVWTSRHDLEPPYLVGTWATSDSAEVAHGAGLLAEACDALGLAGQDMLEQLLICLDAEQRAVLAEAVAHVAAIAEQGVGS